MRNLLFLFLSIGLFNSCSKSDSSKEVPNYLPLEIGNYWIYANYNIDEYGQASNTGILDSVFVERDTLIQGIRYFVLEGTSYPEFNNGSGVLEILRDSSGYLLDQNGEIVFAHDRFDELLHSHTYYAPNGDSLYQIEFHMRDPGSELEVPAGMFNVINYQGTVTSFKDIQGVPNPRYRDNFFSENVGKVYGSLFYFSSPNVIEKRLLRYHVK